MATFTIKKGLDIKLTGAPESLLGQVEDAAQVAVYPTDYAPLKIRLKVKVGDSVKRGTPIAYDKKNPNFQICAPAGGTIAAIDYGKRRLLERVVINVDRNDPDEKFESFTADQLLKADRTKLLRHLEQTGLIALITARPFSRMAKADTLPKSIFVNGMSTAAFQPDINFVILGNEQEFQAGLNALTRLTDGKVHLCLDAARSNVSALTNARNVEVHTFKGPHPAGNTSVHISRIDPIKPGDVVWAVKAQDVIQLGQLLVRGELPSHRTISLGGPAVKPGAAKHYRVRMGGPIGKLVASSVQAGEIRCIAGDFLGGHAVPADGFLHIGDHGFTILPEDRERHFMGWVAPGFNRLSVSNTFFSRWFGGLKKSWALGTNQRGELRPMVITGHYDKYVPMNIMTDYLVRAVLANDTTEAIALGLLETDPEDFALCAFVCPSKMDLCSIIRKGLDLVEKEGI